MKTLIRTSGRLVINLSNEFPNSLIPGKNKKILNTIEARKM